MAHPLSRWIVLLAAAAPVAGAAILLSLPAALLMAGLLAGLVVALMRRTPPIPRPAVVLSEIFVGVSIGAVASGELFLAFAKDWPFMLVALAGTLAAAFASGQVLRWNPNVTLGTSLLASIPGGAVGVIAASDRPYVNLPVVSAVQYARVVVLVFTLPLAARMFGGEPQPGAHRPFVTELLSGWGGSQLLFTAIVLAASLLVHRFVRFSSSTIIISMTLAAALATTGLIPSPGVPGAILNIAYFVIGANIGQKFTRESLRVVVATLPLVALYIALAVAGGLLLPLLISRMLGVPVLDAFLATTPAGIFPAIAVAISSGADVAPIAAVQFVRVFVALALIPVCERIARPRTRPAEGGCTL